MREYDGEIWMREHKYQWMTDDQFDCYKMLCDLFGGSHHVHDAVKSAADGIEINKSYCDLATFDFSTLTAAVLMAHDRCIRFSVSSSGPGRLRLMFHKRHKREGSMTERHPTIEQAIEIFRKSWGPAAPSGEE
jgi:hypothetical protein